MLARAEQLSRQTVKMVEKWEARLAELDREVSQQSKQDYRRKISQRRELKPKWQSHKHEHDVKSPSSKVF